VSRVVWLDGGFVDPATAALSIDDPGVRYGDGLFETMRAERGVIPWLARHLDRLERSIAALGLAPMPKAEAVRAAAEAVALALPPAPARIRVTVTPRPTLLVEGEPISPDRPRRLTAAAFLGLWHPARAIAEHKTLSFIGWRDSQRRAAAAGADTGLLLDGDGRLGEASTANVFCVIGGELVTPPARGILPGITRAVVLELTGAREEMLDEPTWRAAEEMFLTSGVRGVVGVASCDGRVVGDGGEGVTREVAAMVAERVRPPGPG
jgi:branched-subunit amino acid aminotransferase/4-amino-4-deoxychorismate lyase